MTDRSGRTCSIDECPSPAFGRGWCQKHYARWREHGDPLHATRRYVQQGGECSQPGCEGKPKSLGLCAKHAHRQERHGDTGDPRERRFWAKVNKDGPIPEQCPDLGACWIWTGYIDPKTGYGQFGGKGAKGTNLPHRISYQYCVGPIGKGLHLDHLCRVRACVNPAHLEPVTPQENIRRGDQGAFWGYQPEPVSDKPRPAMPAACTECNQADRPIYKRTLCRLCYRKWLKDPDAERPSQRTAEQRFWAKVEKTGACWLWTASVNPKTGYGRFGPRHGQMIDAHRYSYALAFGPVPEKHDVHHTCHVRRCVNPAHLQALTRSENLRLRKVRRAA